MVLRHFQDGGEKEREEARQAAFLMGGVVICSLLFNSTSTKFLIRVLELSKPTPTQLNLFREVKTKMKRSLNNIIAIAEDQHPINPLGSSSLKDIDVGDYELLKEKRFRFRLAMKRKIQVLANHFLVSEFSSQILLYHLYLQSSERAAWDGLLDKICSSRLPHAFSRAHENVISCGKGMGPQRLWFSVIKYFTRKWAGFACEIAFAFLAAHEEGRKRMTSLYTDEETIHQESLEDCEKPAAFLDLMHQHAAPVLRKMKSDQVRHTCRWYGRKYLLLLLRTGVLQMSDFESINKDLVAYCEQVRNINFQLRGTTARDFFPFACAKFAEDEEEIINKWPPTEDHTNMAVLTERDLPEIRRQVESMDL
mmetsp:Transcript_14961/g.31048  ORF Transcript_14961/g.31048 Transcript_14961/m.31048 type:complete len:365 (+) Transcript_14961:1-1095(+)